MSNFNYERYKDIVGAVKYLGEKLEEANESNYTSSDIEDIGCKLISIGNRLRMYIRHSKVGGE
ncbi:hypothetical protein [Romboutsia sp. 1001713B170207_170306_H8]|uniref:hypothetical protein n=1 Tax=Romboutsia sp. 1001713B170207_170306_H8 TaxID=2787112 RepID=UPI00189853B8|nr:hypothetical protein [Romboutsia sp. 1001713B170207_170306_H8]